MRVCCSRRRLQTHPRLWGLIMRKTYACSEPGGAGWFQGIRGLSPKFAACYFPTISSKPSITWSISSTEADPTFLPRRSIESVRICEILTHDCLGNFLLSSSRVSGKPAFGFWLVRATAITVPERSLNTSWLIIKTGRSPCCSLPRVGLSSAQRMSPLNILAMIQTLLWRYLRPSLVQPSCRAWRTHEQAACALSARSSLSRRIEMPVSDWGIVPFSQAGPTFLKETHQLK